MKGTVATITLLLSLGSAFAQTHQPYAGLQARPIKALSEQQIADLRAGRGMSLALAAELNGYPGPLHVLEMADQLALTPEQSGDVRRLYDQMKTEAATLGERLIGEEAELDGQFARREASDAAVVDLTGAIGQTQAALRATHLRYHLLTAKILTGEQMHRYAQLRGYAGQGAPEHSRHPH